MKNDPDLENLEAEIPLSGGNMNRVVRVGTTVRRLVGPHSHKSMLCSNTSGPKDLQARRSSLESTPKDVRFWVSSKESSAWTPIRDFSGAIKR